MRAPRTMIHLLFGVLVSCCLCAASRGGDGVSAEGMHLEIGPGQSFESSVVHRSAFAIMLDVGGAVRVRERVWVSFDLTRTSSVRGLGFDSADANGSAGHRTLTT